MRYYSNIFYIATYCDDIATTYKFVYDDHHTISFEFDVCRSIYLRECSRFHLGLHPTLFVMMLKSKSGLFFANEINLNEPKSNPKPRG